MKVMVQTSLDGCPDSCAKLDIDYKVDEMLPIINGECSGIIVTVDCSHCEVCGIRDREADGKVRSVV